MDIEVCSESGLHLPDKTRIKIHSIENGACTMYIHREIAHFVGLRFRITLYVRSR